MTDFQKARDILAKWQENLSSPLPWKFVGETEEEKEAVDDANDSLVWVDSREVSATAGLHHGDDSLIVGLSGNLQFIESLDGLLQHHAEDGMTISAVASWVANIADAIVASDEGVNNHA